MTIPHNYLREFFQKRATDEQELKPRQLGRAAVGIPAVVAGQAYLLKKLEKQLMSPGYKPSAELLRNFGVDPRRDRMLFQPSSKSVGPASYLDPTFSEGALKPVKEYLGISTSTPGSAIVFKTPDAGLSMKPEGSLPQSHHPLSKSIMGSDIRAKNLEKMKISPGKSKEMLAGASGKHRSGPWGADAGLLAHELGHRYNFNKMSPRMRSIMSRARRVGMVGAGLGSTITALAPYEDPKDMWTVAGISSASALPMVAEELVASAVGASKMPKTLKRYGGGSAKRSIGFRGRMKPFAGTPSYILMALLPLAIAAVRQKTNAFKRKKEQVPAKEKTQFGV